MRVYIVMSAYWMYQSEVDKVFDNEVQAKNYVEQQNKKPNIHSYIIEKDFEK